MQYNSKCDYDICIHKIGLRNEIHKGAFKRYVTLPRGVAKCVKKRDIGRGYLKSENFALRNV